MEISKKKLEEELGYEIRDFKVEVNDGMVDIYIEKMQTMGTITNNIVIQKSGIVQGNIFPTEDDIYLR